MDEPTDKPAALVITRNLPPLIGGMERLVWHIVDALHDDYRVHVIGPCGCGSTLPSGVTANEIPLKPLPMFLFKVKVAAIKEALRVRPKLVFAGSGLTVPFALLASRLTGARCVAYLHGLDIEATHPVYKALWLPFIRHCDRVLVNSHFTFELAIKAGIDSQKVSILHPGVELPEYHSGAKIRFTFRQYQQLGEGPLMLYVGRLTKRKGLAAFVRNILPTVIGERPDAKLLVIGDEPRNAAQPQSGEKRKIEQALVENALSDKVIFLTNVDDDTLHGAYFAADVLVFPVQDIPNDHEGFGMVALEAAAHGLPTVAFAAGGVTDAVKDGVSGALIASGDDEAFGIAVVEHLTAQTGKPREECLKYATSFAWDVFGKSLKRCVESQK